ncbi:MAG: FeoA family protein [Bacteriovoracaceae bacterium]|jgi:Fe2+ transport system protein FeoA|nr:FeoA family protein [Bacteriovoracaceae bacterium]|tara:strand:+ start:61 stop:297 length:237 start_codon:yes stop_codon:yes gene_type:complete
MVLSEAKKGQWYIIEEVDTASSHAGSRYYQLGIIAGEKVMLKRCAPIFKDPLLIQISDSQLALTKAEAALIKIKALGS